MSEPLHRLSLDELLQRLSEERDDLEHVREEVLQRGASIIQDVIEVNFVTSGFEPDELFRPGYLGLLNAVYNFDLSRGKNFRDYAENLIKGEIRHHIRDQVKKEPVPRWMKDLNRKIELTEARLLRETGRLPSLRELSDAVNITEEGLAEIFKAREAMGYVSLDAKQRANDPVFEIDISQIRSKRTEAFPVEYRIRLASALEKLADLQQYLLRGLFSPSEQS
jgi:DNA-directed RNA polymerase specialized sigma subunit